MINVGKNLQLNTDMMTVLSLLKQTAREQGKFIFAEFKENGEQIQTNCPFHSNGQEKKPSFGINTTNGLWHCFACSDDEGSGNLPQLIQKVLGLNSYKDGEQWLIDNFNSSILVDSERPQIVGVLNPKFKNNNISKGTPNFVSEEELKGYRFYHPYMYERGLTNDIIAKFDIGYDKEFRLKLKKKDKDGNPIFSNPIECITFPVRDRAGNCLFVARRAIYTKLFHYPESVDKPLYGLYELYRFFDIDKIKEILICESMLDALKFNAWNKDETKFALALNGLGSELQFTQIQLLPQRAIILATDNDERGLKARNNIMKHVKNKSYYLLEIPIGCKDLNDMSEEQINDLHIKSEGMKEKNYKKLSLVAQKIKRIHKKTE